MYLNFGQGNANKVEPGSKMVDYLKSLEEVKTKAAGSSSSGQSSQSSEGVYDDGARASSSASNSPNSYNGTGGQLDTDYFTDEEDEGQHQGSNGSLGNKVDLDLPSQFISEVVGHYGSQPDLRRLSLYPDVRNVLLSTAITFDIFRYVYATVDYERLLWGQGHFGFPEPRGRQLQRQRPGPSRSQPCGTYYSSSNTSSTGNSSGSSPSPSPPRPPTDMEQEEEDFQEILRQIAELEEESDRAYALELEKLELQGLEEATVAGFKDIIERDKIKAARELMKYQELRKIKWTMAQNIKCSQLKTLFPSLQPKIVEDIFLEQGFSYDQALAVLKDVYPSKYVERPVSRGGGGEVSSRSCIVRNGNGGGNDWFYDPETVAALSQIEKTQLLEQASLWRMEADQYAKQYETAKKDAIDHKLLKQVYSLKTMDASDCRHAANKALEQYWFFTLMGLNAGNKNPNKIDLHGLGVNKAKEIVQKYLQNRKAHAGNCLAKNGTLLLTVITGQGRHSLNNIPRLNPAIRQFLQDNHYSFTEGESPGHFFVRLTHQEDKKGSHPPQQPIPAKKITVKARTK